MAQPVDYTDYRLNRLREVAGRFEIRPDYVVKLRQLEGYEIVLLCDDSGSMGALIDQKINTSDPFRRNMTRWDELRQYVTIVTDVAATLDANGLDIYFLNRPPITGVSSAQQIQGAFAYPPQGYTPLNRVFNQIMNDKAAVIREKKLLLIIATDGQPTDDSGNGRIEQFLTTLKNRPKNVFLSIIACTDDSSSVEYLNKLDRAVPGLDVCDDYRSEHKEVLKAQGSSYKFSFGDYVVKTLLGSIDPMFDHLDEKNIQGGCCTIC